MTLTIAYITARKNPMIQWFFDSLRRECSGNYEGIKIIVVDFWRNEPQREAFICGPSNCDFLHVAPKPTVWQGPHRLTKVDYFAASNTRNTALCYAQDGWISYVDDLTVLLPGWLASVRRAIAGGYVCCGAYRKVKNLIVENGEVKGFEDQPSGNDHRIPSGSDKEAVPCDPRWLYGCSVAMPVESLLKTNGWPEVCDSTGIGLEDCHTGVALSGSGYSIRYDRSMMTLESEDHHLGFGALLRMNKNAKHFRETEKGTCDPNDKGHAIVKMLSNAKRFDQPFGDIAELRQRTLNGKPFPIPTGPTTDFYDEQPLFEL